MYALTFVFAGKIHSPPKGSYKADPTEEFDISPGLKTLTFGVCNVEGLYYLSKVRVEDENGWNLG